MRKKLVQKIVNEEMDKIFAKKMKRKFKFDGGVDLPNRMEGESIYDYQKRTGIKDMNFLLKHWGELLKSSSKWEVPKPYVPTAEEKERGKRVAAAFQKGVNEEVLNSVVDEALKNINIGSKLISPLLGKTVPLAQKPFDYAVKGINKLGELILPSDLSEEATSKRIAEATTKARLGGRRKK